MPDGLPILSILLYIDVHVIDTPDTSAVALKRLHADGWVQLHVTDTAQVEMSQAKDEKRDRLLRAVSAFPLSRGPGVYGHSNYDVAVYAGDHDDARLDAVHHILWPNSPREAEGKLARRRIRDSMHVATAIRYGAAAFVTLENAMLRKDAEIAAKFDGFHIWSPERALAVVEKRMANLRRTSDS